MNVPRISISQSIADIFQSGQNADRAYWKGIFREVAEAVAKKTNQNADHIEGALADPKLHDSGLLNSIIKVEYFAKKTDASRFETKVDIYLVVEDSAIGGKAELTKITLTTSNLSWQDLPTQVRKGFIMDNYIPQKIDLFTSMT